MKRKISDRQLQSIRAAATASQAKRLAADSCRHGHKYVAGSWFINKSGKRRCRVCRRIFECRLRKNGNLPEHKIRQVFALLREGKVLSEIVGVRGSRHIPNGIVKPHRMSSFLRENPKVRAVVVKLSQKNLLLRPSIIVAASSAILRNDGADAFEAIQCITRNLDFTMRGPIQSDMWTDVTEGRLRIASVAGALKTYIARWYRENRFTASDRYGGRSLDAAMTPDGFTLLDTLEDGAGWSVPISTGRRIGTRGSRT